MSKDTVTATSIKSPSSAELESIFSHSMELERQGKLDDAAIKLIDAQIKDFSERLEKETAVKISEINASHQINSVLRPKPIRILVLSGVFFILIGFILEILISRKLKLGYAYEYRDVILWSLFIVIPFMSALWFRLEKRTHILRNRYPTWVIRWVVMFPLLSVFSSIMIVVSPFGWFSFYGWVVGMLQ